MDMMYMVWLVLVMGYGFFKRAAGKFSQAVLCFLDGGYLAFLCFRLLPYVMGTVHFYPAVAATAVGVLAGVRMEKFQLVSVLIFALVAGAPFFWQDAAELREVLVMAFIGGMGLYHASAGIIPEQVEIKNALLSGAGFLVGTILFSCF